MSILNFPEQNYPSAQLETLVSAASAHRSAVDMHLLDDIL